ncbi:MAG: DUF3047 domain-containing protein [Gammaproteobacteria bacterium]
MAPLIALLAAWILPAQGGERILSVGSFSMLPPGTRTPPGWEMLTFKKVKRHTRYLLTNDGGTTVIEAFSRNAAAGLIRRLTIDPRRYPIIHWRWKIARMIPGSDLHRRQGDDYPVRLYITFAYDPEHMSWGQRLRYRAARLLYGDIPAAAINYIWARQVAPGTIVDNAYTDFTKMIVVESGPTLVDQWVTEKRDIDQDFRRAFGYPPPRITGVAIMTDTDDTGAEALSYYGDITFHQRP